MSYVHDFAFLAGGLAFVYVAGRLVALGYFVEKLRYMKRVVKELN